MCGCPSSGAAAATRGGSWILFSLLFATSVSAADQADDAEHLLFLGEQGLAVIRLRIEIDGQSQRELCRICLDAICRAADRDLDGAISDVEYDARIVNHPILQERLPGPMMPRPNARPERPEFPSGGLPIVQMVDYLLHRHGSPLAVQFAAKQLSRISGAGDLMERPVADTRLFERLDTDGNRKLTAREIGKASSVLARLDFDEDEAISLEELQLQTGPSPAPDAMSNRPARNDDGEILSLSRDRIDAQFVRRIMSQYDGETKGAAKDLRLEQIEIQVSADIFSDGDVDGDGTWDFDELWRFLERPTATIEVHIQLVTGSDTVTKCTIVDADAARWIDQRTNRLEMVLYGARMQWLLPPSLPGRLNGDDQLKIEFGSLDGDKNAYLESSEYPFGGDGESPSPLFRAMDTDDDGKVFLPEYLAYHHRSHFQRASFLLLNVENLERTLFGPLDQNSDGRLSPRELAGLKDRLAEWDADGDGKLAEAEIPKQYRWTLSHGSGPQTQLGVAAGEVAPVEVPLWFRKMDRNRDGEVSLREFLGTTAHFEKIDANSDGAIDADEAARVK